MLLTRGPFQTALWRATYVVIFCGHFPDGAEKFARTARALKKAGAKDLRRELYRGVQRAAKPLKEAAKESARSTLPKRGGLAARVAGARYSTRTKAGRNPSVRIEVRDAAGRKVDVEALDRGVVRHLTFGHRPLVEQRVRPDWFMRPMREGGDDVRRELEAAVDRVAAKLVQ